MWNLLLATVLVELCEVLQFLWELCPLPLGLAMMKDSGHPTEFFPLALGTVSPRSTAAMAGPSINGFVMIKALKICRGSLAGLMELTGPEKPLGRDNASAIMLAFPSI